MPANWNRMVDLYRKIEKGKANEDEKFEFELGLNCRFFEKEYIMKKIKKEAKK